MNSRSEASRQRLIDAAIEALINGHGSFDLQDVARRAGVSVGLPSHRFGSKAGLVAAVVNHFYDEVAAAITLTDFEATDWTLREQERLSRLIGYLYRNPLSEIIFASLAREPEVAAVETQRWEELIALTASNITKGQKRAQLPQECSASTLSALICGGIRHAIASALSTRPRPSQARLKRDIWAFVSAGLQLDPRVSGATPKRKSRT